MDRPQRMIQLLGLGLILSLGSCGPKKENVVSNRFCLNDTLMRSIRVESIGKSNYHVTLVLPGSVTFNEDKVIKLFPLVSGTVAEVKVQLGDQVKKGQVLAVIRSAEMAGFSNDLITTRANQDLAKRNYTKTKQLFQSGLASQLDLVGAERDVEKANSDVNRITQVLRINGSGSAGSNYVVKAPVDGFIVDKQLNPGTQIRTDNANNLFMISDLHHVWVMANVYEADIVKVSVGQPVLVSTLSYPDKSFAGTIDRLYNVLDPINKTMKVRIQLNNPDFLLKPQMFASVSVKTQLVQSKLGIPSSAIIFDNSKNYVMVFKDRCSIETREIKLGHTDGAISYVEDGLSAEEKIIVKNPLFVYQALNQ